MKRILNICLTVGMMITTSCAATQSPTKVLLAQVQTDKIAQVKAGTLKEANASWWGFDREDATDALQNAINSKVSKLIVDNTGGDWVINKPIKLVSNQEIVFADGVVVQAKKDNFKGTGDSLITGTNLKNVTLRGEGNAVLRMQKKDYQDPKKYKAAEWRMGIRLVNCQDVILRNLTVTETGGDGLYLGASPGGYNKNILVEDMNFDANHRLGMAVISAENLTIRRCKFNNTLGTGPNGGLDFEPNYAEQRLVNILVQDCEFNNNVKGTGMQLYTVKLNGKSKPISITFENCRTSGNAQGFGSTIMKDGWTTNAVQGKIIVKNCVLDHDVARIRNNPTNSTKIEFIDSVIDLRPIDGKYDTEKSPVQFISTNNTSPVMFGGVKFQNTRVIIGDEAQPISTDFNDISMLSDNVTGALLVTKNNETKPFDLLAFVKKQQQSIDREYWNKVQSLHTANTDPADLQAPPKDAAREDNDEFYLQGTFTFLQYAEKGQEITINLVAHKSYDRDTIVELQDPAGKKIESYKLPLDGSVFPIKFTADQTGLYRVVRKSTFSQRVDVNSSHRGNGLLAEKTVRFLPKKGQLYFQVPVGVKEFSVGVSTNDKTDVALLDANGNEVERHKGTLKSQFFTGKRDDASKSEIWSLRVAEALWLVDITMYDPLPAIVSTNPATLLQVK